MTKHQIFETKRTTLRVVIEYGIVKVEHDGHVEVVELRENLEYVAAMVADVVKGSILSMPKNDAKEIQMNCSWK